MVTINMHDAKTQLSDLVARAEAGEEIVIARRNKPAVRLVPIHENTKTGIREARKRIPGRLSNPSTTMTESDWFARLPEDELQAWEGDADPGFGESEQATYDLAGLPEALATGKEFTVMQGGKAVAKVVPVEEKRARVPGRFAHLRGNLPSDLFDQPLDQDELHAWEGKYSGDGDPGDGAR